VQGTAQRPYAAWEDGALSAPADSAGSPGEWCQKGEGAESGLQSSVATTRPRPSVTNVWLLIRRFGMSDGWVALVGLRAETCDFTRLDSFRTVGTCAPTRTSTEVSSLRAVPLFVDEPVPVRDSWTVADCDARGENCRGSVFEPEGRDSGRVGDWSKQESHSLTDSSGGIDDREELEDPEGTGDGVRDKVELWREGDPSSSLSESTVMIKR